MAVITKILRIDDELRLTKSVDGFPDFTAGTVVKIVDVRFMPMTPPPGVDPQNYLSAVYKIAMYKDVNMRRKLGDMIQSDKAPHALLAMERRGTPSTAVYEGNKELFLIHPFSYKSRGHTITLPRDTPVQAVPPGGVTNKGSKTRRPEAAVYSLWKQEIVTVRQEVRAGPVSKIYFE